MQCNINKADKIPLNDIIIVLLTIVISDDSFWFSAYNNQTLILIKNIVLLGLPFVLLKNNRFTRTEIQMFSFVICWTFISGIFNGFALGGPILLCFVVAGSILMSNKINIQTFGILFSKIIFLLCIYSLFVWLLLSLNIMEPGSVENGAGVFVHTLFFCQFFDDYTGSFYRNAAIFREPGVFMIFINIAFLFDIYCHKKIDIKKLAIYTISIFSTFSTAGYIIFLVLVFIYFVKNGFSFKRLLPLLLFGLVILYFVSSENLMTNVFGKFENGEDSHSVLGRISSIYIPLNIMIEHPFFGVGTEMFRAAYIKQGLEIFHMEIDPQGLATNTIFNIGAIFGLVFFIGSIIGLYKLSNHFSDNKIHQFFIFISFLFMFSNESMVYSYIFILMLTYGFKRTNLINTKVHG